MEPEDNVVGETSDRAEALRDVFDDLEARSRSFGSALTGALKAATADGKGLEDVLRGLGNRLTGIALSSGLKPLGNLIGEGISGLTAGFGKLFAFANGGVVSSPTYFPMGGDMGLMGEAGAEAILPLRRGADGALGVAATAGGGQPQIVFNVTAADADSFRKTEGQLSAMLARSVRRGHRNL
ncbi:phage tail tape measure protein [Rhizobiaceae bacterium n13]|uniref:Phage tail tape measure protein n=1 Tax=Ferirhizobium litorale TaxID=2927786 RepID=A0AAE3QAP6_9HYPH|nr:phage tail tape measure protein [Fererhizobium litorale]MDI7861259.1 phage tail tape measure protein [Fererhizobium litorale]MDI7921406.1 phage tail tape measure protein [Fererhizobium litorale]